MQKMTMFIVGWHGSVTVIDMKNWCKSKEGLNIRRTLLCIYNSQ